MNGMVGGKKVNSGDARWIAPGLNHPQADSYKAEEWQENFPEEAANVLRGFNSKASDGI